jgi:hypothetical protein
VRIHDLSFAYVSWSTRIGQAPLPNSFSVNMSEC